MVFDSETSNIYWYVYRIAFGIEMFCFNVSQKTVEYFIKHKMLQKILPIDFTDDLNFLPWLVKGSLASKQRELQGGWVSMLW